MSNHIDAVATLRNQALDAIDTYAQAMADEQAERAATQPAWQVQIRSGDDQCDFWKPVVDWDCGHTVKLDTFPTLKDAIGVLETMENAYEEHSFRVHPLAAPISEDTCIVQGAEELPLCVGSCAKRGQCIERPARTVNASIGSIRSPQFLNMLDAYATDGDGGYEANYSRIVAYIDQWSARTDLSPMQNEEDQDAGIVRQWYFNCDGHYIDVALDDGKYSIFFRDKAGNGEAWMDQADTPTADLSVEIAEVSAREADMWMVYLHGERKAFHSYDEAECERREYEADHGAEKEDPQPLFLAKKGQA